MDLRNKKTIVARLAKTGKQRVWFNPAKLSDIKEAITKDDLKNLMRDGTIAIKQKDGHSRGRSRKILAQKRKGRQTGRGSRKGPLTARTPQKKAWISRIRSQRSLVRELFDKKVINAETYRDLRTKCKGGFFRNKRHIKLYVSDHQLWLEKHGKQ